MREKLLNLMKSEGLTSSRLAEILEIQPSGVSHILSGRNKPGFDLLQKILRRFPRINPDWLLLDSNAMYRDNMPDQFSAFDATMTDRPISQSGADHSNLFASSQLAASSSTTPTPIAQQGDRPTNGLAEATGQSPRHTQQADVVRVVVFYSDQTCESFSSRPLQ